MWYDHHEKDWKNQAWEHQEPQLYFHCCRLFQFLSLRGKHTFIFSKVTKSLIWYFCANR